MIQSKMIRIGVLLIAAGVFGQGAAFACEGMKKDIHAGTVKSIGENSFVLVEASSGKAQTFDATTTQLKDLQPGEQVKVKSATDEGRMKAIEVGK